MMQRLLLPPLLVWPILLALLLPVESPGRPPTSESYTIFPSVVGPSGGMLCRAPDYDGLFTLGIPAGGRSANADYLLWSGFKPPAPRVYPLCPTWAMIPLPHPEPGTTPGFRTVAPSPGAGTLRIAFEVVATGPASVTVHDPAGRLIRNLLQIEATPGIHEVTWNGCDDDGHPVPTGIYLLHLTHGLTTDVRKFVVLH
jgi:hypothetical protein